ncbi:MAG: hypothetical protein JSW25_02175 [Thermoplasmata archaeon]|nr:MAG: hypothetical protein JSW25_02175 [Thermoplasmata archaeon]
MSSKYAVVVIIIMAAILLTGFGRNDVQADTDLVTDIEYSPDPYVIGETLEISCTLTDETNVESVVLTVCNDAICFTPIPMEKGSDDVWRGTSNSVEELVSHKFNITVYFDDTSKVWTEDIYFDPTEKTDNGNNGDDDNGIIPALGAVAVLAVLGAVFLVMRGRGGDPDTTPADVSRAEAEVPEGVEWSDGHGEGPEVESGQDEP